ncbi:hypothetical protein [Sorangium cellulosum]|uniref:hypothetical protein n=1 Tax=Sorangium cellulosum TaxID=56 RepID=UPI0010108E8C|nr:hypothetical protein [Sorangium cellulosum]
MSARAARALGAGLCASVALAPAAARAACDGGAADVSWVRLEGAEAQCPAAAQVRAEVSRRLRRELGATGEGPSIEAVVQGRPGAWSAQIRTEGCDGAPPAVRKLTDSAMTCEPIATAATLLIALAIDPEADLSEPPPAPAADPEPPPPPRPAPAPAAISPPAEPPFPWPAEPPPRPPPAEPPPPPSLSVAWRGLAALGLLPAPAPGAALSAEWSFLPRWTLSTGALWLPELRADDPTFAFGITAGWLGACVEAIRSRAVALGVCGRLVAGSIHAVIFEDLDEPRVVPTTPGARPWLSAAAGPRLAVRVVGPLRIEAGVDLLVPATRYSFRVQGDLPAAFEQPAVAGTVFGGLGVTFR